MTEYERFINDILETRGRVLDTRDKERHHILPRCLGGTDNPQNLVDLTIGEHYTAHKLLAIENPDNLKLQYAFTRMATVIRDGDHRILETPEEYTEARMKAKEKINQYNKTHEPPMKNRKHTPEAIEKMKEAHKHRDKSTYFPNSRTPEKIAQRVKKFKETYWSKPEEERREIVRKSVQNRTPPKYWQGKRIPDYMREKISQTLKEKHLCSPIAIQVYCRETDTTYRSMTEAEQDTGVDRHIIKKYIEGKRRDEKFHFSYVENNRKG